MIIDPTPFAESQAWLLFQLNDVPVCTASDGDFNLLAIMDVATGVIFGMEFIALDAMEPSEFKAKKLLAAAEYEAGKRPDTLFIFRHGSFPRFVEAAKALGMEVVLTAGEAFDQLTREAREGFTAHVTGARTH